MSFDDVQKEIKELEKEFNSKLVSTLNSCEEPVVCNVLTTACGVIIQHKYNLTKDTPIFINAHKSQDVGKVYDPVYGATLVK
jgi:hypothetical protein